jgi:hypothetical protein
MEDEIAKDAVPSSGAVPPRLPVIPDHHLLKCIGEGSYGQIWLVRNILGSYRAAKVVFRDKFKSVQPFEREFQGIRIYEPISRTHNGLVQILQVGKNDRDGYFYYVMELADDQFTRQVVYPEMYVAKTLEIEIRLRGRLPAQECVKIGLCLAAALGHLHEGGLVHRDIKPANLIYLNGQIKLADIGLVADVRNAKTAVGTEGFMPPEGSGTVQADIFSTGKVLYEMATGKDRFDFPAPSTRIGEFSDRKEVNQLAKILHRTCADSPRDRYRSAKDLYNDLLKLDRQFAAGSVSLWKPFLLIGGLIAGLLGAFCFAVLVLQTAVRTEQQAHFDLQARIGPTNAIDLPAPIGRLVKAGSDGSAYLLTVWNLSGGQLGKLIATNEAPKGMSIMGAAEGVWKCTETARAYLLESGTNRIQASMIMATSEIPGSISESLGSNTLVNVFTAIRPQNLAIRLVFEVPHDLDPLTCTYTNLLNTSALGSDGLNPNSEVDRRFWGAGSPRFQM